MKKILSIGDHALYRGKLKTSDYTYYKIDFLDSLSVEVASSIFQSYNMVILDHHSLKKHSYTLCHIAKKLNITVLFLFSTTCTETEILHSFDVGADDYIYPLLSTPTVILKKIELILSRLKPTLSNNIYQDSHMILNFRSLTAIIGSTTIKFTPLEFKLLQLFIKNSNTVLTRQQILYYLWDRQENYVEENSLNSMICRIRRRIDTSELHYIKTIYGIGYIWTSPPQVKEL